MQTVDAVPMSPKPPAPINQGSRLARQWNIVFWGTAVTLALVLVLITILKPFSPDQFIYLARNFANGRLSVDDMPRTYSDYAIWEGHLYLPSGPLPAILLIPFLPLFQAGFLPGWVSIAYTTANVCLLYLICKKLGFSGEKQRWVVLLFFGGTVYFSMATVMVSWYFAHVVGTTFILWSILEILGQKRPLLIGLLIGLAAATRSTLGLALPFYLMFFWPFSSQTDPERKLLHHLREIALLGLGLAVPIALLLGYNYARFGNPFETGYKLDVFGSPDLVQYCSYGLFAVSHIPLNLFYLLLQGPVPYPALEAPIYTFPFLQPSPMGMAVLFTSPALLYVFRAKLRQPVVKAGWLAIAVILVPLLLYCGTGWITFGDRYTLDFMPFMVLIAAYGLPEPLNNRARGLIILSVIINLWGSYWLHSWLYKPA